MRCWCITVLSTKYDYFSKPDTVSHTYPIHLSHTEVCRNPSPLGDDIKWCQLQPIVTVGLSKDD